MPECIFCEIVAGKLPSYKFRENEEFEAILDAFPEVKGQTLVIPKKHYDSDLFLIDEAGFYERYLQAGKTVAEILKEKLQVTRVSLVVEGLMVNHVHLRLYPLYPHIHLAVEPSEKKLDQDLGEIQQLLT